MSIQDSITTISNELTRIASAKSSIATAIAGKGVTVPAKTKLDGYASLINSISQGGGGENTIPTLTVSFTGAEIEPSQYANGYFYATGVNSENLTIDIYVDRTYNLIPLSSYTLSINAPSGYTATVISGSTSGSVEAGDILNVIYQLAPRTDCIVKITCQVAFGQFFTSQVSQIYWTIDDGATWTKSGNEYNKITFKHPYTLEYASEPGYTLPEPAEFSMTTTTGTGYSGEPKLETTVNIQVDYQDKYYIDSHPDSAAIGEYTQWGTKTYESTSFPIYSNGTRFLAMRRNMYSGDYCYYLLATESEATDTTSYEINSHLGQGYSALQPLDTYQHSGNTPTYFNVTSTPVDDSILLVSGSDGYDGAYTEYSGSTGKAKRWKNEDTGMVITNGNSSGSSWYFVPVSEADNPGMNMESIYANTPTYQPPYKLDGSSRIWEFYKYDHVSGRSEIVYTDISIVPSYGTGMLTVNVADAPNGAAWSFDDGKNWIPVNRLWRVPPGTYDIIFRTVNGYNSPDSQRVTISAGVSSSVSAEYTMRSDNTTVTITPTNVYDSAVAETTKTTATWQIISKTDGVSSPVGKFTGAQTVVLQPGDYIVKGDTCSGYNCGPTYLELHNETGGSSYSVYICYASNSIVSSGGYDYGYAPFAEMRLQMSDGKVFNLRYGAGTDGTYSNGYGWLYPVSIDGNTSYFTALTCNFHLPLECRLNTNDGYNSDCDAVYTFDSADNAVLQAENSNYFGAWHVSGVRVCKRYPLDSPTTFTEITMVFVPSGVS